MGVTTRARRGKLYWLQHKYLLMIGKEGITLYESSSHIEEIKVEEMVDQKMTTVSEVDINTQRQSSRAPRDGGLGWYCHGHWQILIGNMPSNFN